MRERTGEIFQNKKTKKWIARVGYTSTRGKRTAIQKTAETEVEAKKLLKKLLEKFEKGGAENIENDKIIFGDFLDYYEKQYVKPAKFVDDRKIEGMRNWKKIKGFIKVFRDYFGKMKICKIGYDEILAYRSYRYTIPTHYKTTRNIATMNREISSLRRIFNIAVRNGILARNPVNSGEPLIDKSAERRRDRILTIDEEKRLLNACIDKRAHIKPLIIVLLDTGARKGETLLLKFSDLDFEKRLITFQALNTKTLKTRSLMMTNRVFDELQKIWENSDKNLDSYVFNFTYVRKAFLTACEVAEIETGRPNGITIHSLRHTAATRLVRGQMPIQMVGRILSHQDPITTYRYLSANDETLQEAVSIFESIQEQNYIKSDSSFDFDIESDFVN